MGGLSIMYFCPVGTELTTKFHFLRFNHFREFKETGSGSRSWQQELHFESTFLIIQDKSIFH